MISWVLKLTIYSRYNVKMMTSIRLLVVVWCLGIVSAEYIPPGPRYRCPQHKSLILPCTCDTESDQGITVSCQNTNLAAMSVGLNNLATFKLPIEKLTLYKCNIGKLTVYEVSTYYIKERHSKVRNKISLFKKQILFWKELPFMRN